MTTFLRWKILVAYRGYDASFIRFLRAQCNNVGQECRWKLFYSHKFFNSFVVFK